MSPGWEAHMPPKSCSHSPRVPATCLCEFNVFVWPNKPLLMMQKKAIERDLCSDVFENSWSFSFHSLLISSGRILVAPNMATFAQAIQRQVLSVTPVPSNMIHAVANIPHHPSYHAPTDRIFYMAHTCQPACLNRVRPSKPDLHSGKNPLLMPLLYDFRRMTGRRKVNRKVNTNIQTTLENMGIYTHTHTLERNKMTLFVFCFIRCPSTWSTRLRVGFVYVTWERSNITSSRRTVTSSS